MNVLYEIHSSCKRHSQQKSNDINLLIQTKIIKQPINFEAAQCKWKEQQTQQLFSSASLMKLRGASRSKPDFFFFQARTKRCYLPVAGNLTFLCVSSKHDTASKRLVPRRRSFHHNVQAQDWKLHAWTHMLMHDFWTLLRPKNYVRHAADTARPLLFFFMTDKNKMHDTHKKTQYKMHKSCLLNLNEKYHCNADTNMTRTAVGCRPDMTEIHDDIRTADRSHVNQKM